MDPHPLANLFKRSNYVDPIASELSALDFLYGVLLEMRESENRDEEIYEMIHEGSLNEKHDCNGFTTNSISDNHAKNMQNPKLGDASFAMSTTCSNDHDWGNDFFMVLTIFLSLMMNMIFAILLKVGLEKS